MLFKEYVMAQSDKVQLELTAWDKLWIKKALETQRRVLERARSNEMPGSEIYVWRGKEIEALTTLIGRMS